MIAIVYKKEWNTLGMDNYNDCTISDIDSVTGETLDDAIDKLLSIELTDNFVKRYVECDIRRGYYTIDVVKVYQIVDELDDFDISDHPKFMERMKREREVINTARLDKEKTDAIKKKERELRELKRLQEKYGTIG